MKTDELRKILNDAKDHANYKHIQEVLRHISGLFPQLYTVEVLQEEGGSKNYLVRATTEEDALQIAFALDGGWGNEQDAQGMLPLAQMHCSITQVSGYPYVPDL